MKEFWEDEKIIARNIDKKYKWIARDRCTRIHVFVGKPNFIYCPNCGAKMEK